VGFEPTIAVLERAKTVRALDRSATAIGCMSMCVYFVFVMSCVKVAALRKVDPPFEEFYRQ
jgi:hypothetical protein